MLKELSSIKKRLKELTNTSGRWTFRLGCSKYPDVGESFRFISTELGQCFYLIPSTYCIRHSSREEKKVYFSGDYLQSWIKAKAVLMFVDNLVDTFYCRECEDVLRKIQLELHSVVYDMDKFSHGVINKIRKENQG